METTFYDAVGGEAFFERLVTAFYRAVEEDTILRPMYPDDLADSHHHFATFLIQYWGGPRTYMEERGHPRLRMRHVPYRITAVARDAWLDAMTAAIASVRSELTDTQFTELTAYFDMAAHQMRNE